MNYNIELNRLQINIVRFCANECHNQRSGEKSVARMVEAYNTAINYWKCGERHASEILILKLARKIDPRNDKGYRLTPVVFDHFTTTPTKPEHIQAQMELLLDNQGSMTLDEFTKRFLEIHPFEDGNGRTAAILYNFLDGMLEAPQPLPVYFGEKV